MKFKKDDKDIAWNVLARVYRKAGKRNEALEAERKHKNLKKQVK